MLSSDYFVKINLAARKSLGTEFRNQTINDLIDKHNSPAHNIMEGSRMLWDAASLLGLARKTDASWRFTNLKTIPTSNLPAADSQAQVLVNKLMASIAEFGQCLFTDFNDFAAYWSALQFNDVNDFLAAFYRFVPYAKLGVDAEDEVHSVYPHPPKNMPEADIVPLGLLRQRVVVRRVKSIFLANAPDLLLDADALVDFALRVEEEAIPLSAA